MTEHLLNHWTLEITIVRMVVAIMLIRNSITQLNQSARSATEMIFAMRLGSVTGRLIGVAAMTMTPVTRDTTIQEMSQTSIAIMTKITTTNLEIHENLGRLS